MSTTTPNRNTFAVILFLISLAGGCSLHANSLEPGADEARHEVLYVANSRGSDIAVVDLATLKIRDRIILADRVHGLATDASGRTLFATVESDNTLRLIDTATDHLIATIPLSGRPNECAVTPDGKFVVVPIRDADKVDIIDVSQRKIVKTLALKVPHNAVIYPGSNRYVFVSSMGERVVNLIDLTKLEYSQRLEVGGVPRPYVLGDEGRTMYVAESSLHGFVVVSVADNKVVDRVQLPSINTTPHPRPYEPIDTLTHGLALSPDGNELWVTSLLDNYMYVYSIRDKKVLQRLPSGDGPNWVSFSSDGKFVCVSNTDSHDVSIFDAREHKELARLETGGAPKRVLVADVPLSSSLSGTKVE